MNVNGCMCEESWNKKVENLNSKFVNGGNINKCLFEHTTRTRLFFWRNNSRKKIKFKFN